MLQRAAHVLPYVELRQGDGHAALSTLDGRLAHRLMTQAPAGGDHVAAVVQDDVQPPCRPALQLALHTAPTSWPAQPADHVALATGGGASSQVLSSQLPLPAAQVPAAVHCADGAPPKPSAHRPVHTAATLTLRQERGHAAFGMLGGRPVQRGG